MPYSVARLLEKSLRRFFGQRRSTSLQHRNPTVSLSLERLEERTPPTSLSLFANPLSVVEGQFATIPFTLADSDGNTNASLYSVSINWGDGSGSTSGAVYWNGSNFQPMMSGHTFNKAGSYNIGITVTDADGDQAFLQETATVSDAALSGGTNMPLSATAGQLFSSSVVSFTDANPFASAGDFTAVINWGDGSASSTGTISGGGGGGASSSFTVNGSHDYAAAGTYNYTVTIQDAGGGTLTEQGTFTASAPSGSGSGSGDGMTSGSGSGGGMTSGSGSGSGYGTGSGSTSGSGSGSGSGYSYTTTGGGTTISTGVDSSGNSTTTTSTNSWTLTVSASFSFSGGWSASATYTSTYDTIIASTASGGLNQEDWGGSSYTLSGSGGLTSSSVTYTSGSNAHETGSQTVTTPGDFSTTLATTWHSDQSTNETITATAEQTGLLSPA